MERALKRGIKELIGEHPVLGELLSRKEIGCVTCQVGTCLLKDIVEVHGLSDEEEYKLLAGIAEVIFPGEEVTIPKIERKYSFDRTAIKYSPPMKTLVDEHTLIKKVLQFIPVLLGSPELLEDRGLILETVDFIRSYADRFHHAKEEDILFKFFDQELEILKAMNNEHTAGRAHVRAVLEGVERGDTDSVSAHLAAFRELLLSHIRKEDEVLYPWMDANLSTSETGELFSRFSATDAQFRDVALKQEIFVKRLEERLKYKEETSNV